MTDSAWDPVENVRDIVCLFVPVSISRRPPGVVLSDNDSRLPPISLLRTPLSRVGGLLSVFYPTLVTVKLLI